jgi:Holliday junction resolvasome RuvABC ATP-dependent DNA helicase subunit
MVRTIDMLPQGNAMTLSFFSKLFRHKDLAQGPLIPFSCPSCGAWASAPETCAGQSINCQSCGKPIAVPREPGPSQPVARVQDPQLISEFVRCPSCGNQMYESMPSGEYDLAIPCKCFSCSCGLEVQWPRLDAAPSDQAPSLETPAPVQGPRLISEFVGQDEVRAQMISKLTFARKYREPLPHLLFCAPPECGKSALARCIANELGVSFYQASAKELKNSKATIPLLTNCEEGSIFVIADIELLPDDVIEFLLPVLSDFRVDIDLGDGLNARTISMPLKRFTLVATTSRPSRVDKRLVPWLAPFDFKPYTSDEFEAIVNLMLKEAKLVCEKGEVATAIVNCCDGSLEKARIIVQRMRDFFGNRGARLTLDRTLERLDWWGYRRRATSIDLASRLRAMSGTDFEQHVAAVFRTLGYTVEYTPVTGDHGIDLFLRRGNEKAVVQCKRWEGSVGEPVVREFLGSMTSAGVAIGYIVTTAEFTAQAIEFAEKNQVKLIDLDALLRLADDNGRREQGTLFG